MGLCPACLLKQGAEDSRTQPEATPFVPLSPAELAPYFPQLEILELIGRGGMGAVYQARQKALDRLVAVKILPPGIGADPAFAERFAREAKALAKLNHPNIVTLHEFGQADGLFYFIMEFVDGLNLRQLLHASRIAPREALAIVPQICDALQYAHDHGIVHRDIKPENILLDRQGRVKVADFGLAKLVQAREEVPVGAASATLSAELTEAGKVMGTPQYMAPEQTANPTEVDHRADIYSLGVVFYQMLTGELPKGEFAPPSQRVAIDVRLDQVVLRALEQKPELRYQQISFLKTQIETISQTPAGGDESSVVAGPPSLRLPLLAFALCYAGLLGFLAWTAPLLPGRVASHFGGEGQANGWMSRPGYLLFVGLLPLVLAGIFWGISRLSNRYPSLINIPRRDYWLAPERREATATLLQWWLLWLGCLMVVFFSCLHFLTLEANNASPAQLPMGPFLFVIISFLLALIIWITSFLMHFAEAGKIQPRHLNGRLLLAITIGAVLLELGGLLMLTVRSGPPQSLAQSPQKLRSLPTAEVIKVGLAEPKQPWAWLELERRQRDGRLIKDEINQFIDSLTVWLQRDYPKGCQELLRLEPLLNELSKEKMIEEEAAIRFLMAYHGELSCGTLPRLRENDKFLKLTCDWRQGQGKILGKVMLNEMRSISIDGQPVILHPSQNFSYNCTGPGFLLFEGQLPSLTPGRYRVKCEVDSALVDEKDVEGLSADTPSREWPPAKKRWTRVIETDLLIYAKDAEIVSLTDDPALDPLACGKLSVKHVVIRPKGQGVTAIVSVVRRPPAVPVSFAVIVRLAGQDHHGGGFWIAANTGGTSEHAIVIDRLDPQVREAEVILKPNPKLVESCPDITRIWGKEIVFKHVPLVRYDLPGTPPVAEESLEAPAPTPAVQTVKPAVLPPLWVICWKLVWLALGVVVLWLMRHLENSASIGKAGVLLALAGPFAGILSGKFAFQSTPSGYALFLACEITALVLGILARQTALGRAAWITALVLMGLSLAAIG
jgi:serine/threonine protein kinase